MKTLRVCIFGLLCLLAGAATMYLSRKPQTVIVEVEVEPKIIYATAQTTPASDLVAQVTTYKITYNDPIMVQYVEAFDVVSDDQLVYFMKETKEVARIVPVDRIRSVVRYDVGEKWDCR